MPFWGERQLPENYFTGSRRDVVPLSNIVTRTGAPCGATWPYRFGGGGRDSSDRVVEAPPSRAGFIFEKREHKTLYFVVGIRDIGFHCCAAPVFFFLRQTTIFNDFFFSRIIIYSLYRVSSDLRLIRTRRNSTPKRIFICHRFHASCFHDVLRCGESNSAARRIRAFPNGLKTFLYYYYYRESVLVEEKYNLSVRRRHRDHRGQFYRTDEYIRVWYHVMSRNVIKYLSKAIDLFTRVPVVRKPIWEGRGKN